MNKGFNTLLGTAFIFLASAWLVGVLVLFNQSEFLSKRYSDKSELTVKFEQTLKTILDESGSTYNSSTQLWADFVKGIPLPEGMEVLAIEHSSKLNLNWVRIQMLQDTSLRALFISGDFESLMNKRFKDGPYSTLSEFETYVKKEDLEKYFTVYSLPNINTTDEFMIEKIAGLKSDSPSEGAILRSKVRQFLSQKRVITTQEELLTILGSDQNGLSTLFTVTPELNVNSAQDWLIQALISYAPWKIPNPETKITQILSQRKGKPISKSELQSILQVEKNHPILQYLGVDPGMVEVQLSWEKKKYYCIMLFENTSKTEKKALRLLENGWKK